MSKVSSSEYEDRDDGISQQSSDVGSDRGGGKPSYQEQQVSEDIIDLYGCDFSKFSSYMSKQYGEQQFNEGFAIMSKYKDYIYTEEGESKLVKLLRHIFATEDLALGFINFCTSYIIVQNYSNGMNQ